MHSPAKNSHMNLQTLLPDTPPSTSSDPASPSTPQKGMGPTTEPKAGIQSPHFKSTNSDKQPRKHQQPEYTSFSSLGLREPAEPKRLGSSSQDNLSTFSAPPTAMQQIKSVLGIELPQKDSIANLWKGDCCTSGTCV
ncbi:hypothetical protein BOTCAL_0191g00030 [Botryotinia calthae]|uniref:Uncharacterized protein n=1 Tax=Botryotinia calthae TaxID=38488 RepID=A0A4Y8CZU1_9HELO|nr:hypothetical protein BOTCAL_0191g00030 [Botryotinia calthae]